METINEHIKKYSDWIVQCFAKENLNLDYTINSLKYLDKFLEDNVTNGIPNANGILHKDYKEILYGIGIYLGETIKTSLSDSKWHTEINNGTPYLTGEFELPNGTIIFPIERINKRFENGEEDSIYPYASIIISQISSDNYWTKAVPEKNESRKKPWWKFW